jgi:hypothetical protein
MTWLLLGTYLSSWHTTDTYRQTFATEQLCREEAAKLRAEIQLFEEREKAKRPEAENSTPTVSIECVQQNKPYWPARRFSALLLRLDD